MKFGIRKPNLKKSIKARTVGKVKRKVKKAINPLYGKKGMGYVKNPKKAIYNKVYNKTSFGIGDIFKKIFNVKSKANFDTSRTSNNAYPKKGFDFNYTMEEYSAIKQNRYNISTIQRYLEILKDCGNLINTTKKPDVFFSRYLIALAILNDLIPIENKLNLQGDKPSQIKKQLYDKEIFTVNDFIDRYYQDIISQIISLKTEKAKQKRINDFCNGLDIYKLHLSQESLDKYNNLCLDIQKKK